MQAEKSTIGLANFKKIKNLLNYIVGPVLFILIGFSIYRQISTQPNVAGHWQALTQQLYSQGRWALVGVAWLMLLNWSLEALKWQKLVKHLMPISWGKALLSVLAGISFTMLTPNRMGEFLGRVLYMPDGSRIKAATLTTIGSLSQLIITLSAGFAGFWYLQGHNNESAQWPLLLSKVMLFGTLTALVVMLLVFFNLGGVIRLVEKWPPFSRYAIFIHAIGTIHWRQLVQILLIALLRYGVFLVQYVLVFKAFDIQIGLFPLLAATAAMFLILAVVPTISLAELGIRGQVSLFVFGFFTTDQLGILVASGVIWLINIIFPAVAGSLILLSVKLFSKKSLEQE